MRYFDGRSLLNVGDSESDASSDDEDGSEVANNEAGPEMPIPLFASCSGDRLTNDGDLPWKVMSTDAIVVLQSRVWPGAFAFAKER